MRSEKEVKEFIDELVKEPSLTKDQFQLIARTLRWVLGLENNIILSDDHTKLPRLRFGEIRD